MSIYQTCTTIPIQIMRWKGIKKREIMIFKLIELRNDLDSILGIAFLVIRLDQVSVSGLYSVTHQQIACPFWFLW